MTVLEALIIIKKDLGRIPVRVDDINEIGNPIHNAVQGIGSVIQVLQDAERNAQRVHDESDNNDRAEQEHAEPGDEK